jgi:anti-sigma-K factor RskA
MNSQSFPTDPRFQELLAGFVLGDLDAAERVELERLAREANVDLAKMDYSSLEAAAGAVVAVCASDSLPAGLREKLARAGDEFAAGANREEPRLSLTDDSAERRTDVRGQNAGTASRSLFAWFAAAAAIVLAGVAWLNVPRQASAPMTYEQFVQATPDLVRSAWGDWAEPEIKGVTGEVVWSPSRQQGFMVFKGLPINDPTKEQYQLWIVDERGLADATGQSARISGGVFNIAAGGEVVVPIDPALKVGKAQLFALTIEKPGGTWVSDMTRRVVAAAVK